MDLNALSWGAKDVASGRKPRTLRKDKHARLIASHMDSATGATRRITNLMSAPRPRGTIRRKSLVSGGSRRRRRKKRPNLQLSSLDANHDHLLLPCTLTEDNTSSIRANSMLDSGATGKGFIDEAFAQNNRFTFHKLRKRRRLNVVDGRPSSAGDITHVVKLNMEIKGHKEKGSILRNETWEVRCHSRKTLANRS